MKSFKIVISSCQRTQKEEERTMMLSINTYKVRKADRNPVYKTYRYACFDTALEMEGKTFEEKFNSAMNCLKEEINQDRENNDMVQYEPIIISDVFLS